LACGTLSIKPSENSSNAIQELPMIKLDYSKAYWQK
jgi:hypothetical protein